MPLVLAIEPDHRQSGVLKRIVREHVHADLLLVDSPDAAVAALATQIPDVILVSALLAPQDEEDLFERVHSLDGGAHIQTYTIPQFAPTNKDEATESSGGFFGKFRRKRTSGSIGVNSGCDPDLFAQEIATFVTKALELKTQNLNSPSRNLRLTARETTAGRTFGGDAGRTGRGRDGGRAVVVVLALRVAEVQRERPEQAKEEEGPGPGPGPGPRG